MKRVLAIGLARIGFGLGSSLLALLMVTSPVLAEPELVESEASESAQSEPAQSEPAQTDVPAADTPAANVSAAANTAENRLVLSLGARRVYLYQGDMLLSSYPVAIGTAETPTPQGEFTVSKMVENPVWQSPWTGEIHEPGPNSALGLRWIEFSTTEAGSFGFHGTPTVESIGQAASNGCVRMRNEDVVALYAQVSIGTPVTIEP